MSKPYVGLTPFAETDAAYFFGRESERRVLVDNLLSSRLTLLYGESGAGKSSLLNAGVAFELRAEPEFSVVAFRTWRSDPLPGLIDAISRSARIESNGAPGNLLECIQSCAGRHTLLVVLDQFEEYFHYHPRESAFDDELARVLNHPGIPANFLVSIREDWLAALDRYKGRIPGLFENYLRMQHLSVNGATEAIEGPLRQFNREHPAGEVTWDEGLSHSVIQSILASQSITERGLQRSDRVQAPYLQMVMSALWQREWTNGSHQLRLETLEKELGGARHIYEGHLRATLEEKLSPAERGAALEMFRLLVTGSGRKQNRTARELAGDAHVEESLTQGTLPKLVGALILTKTSPPRGAAPDDVGYEFAHDVLAEAGLKLVREQAVEQERQKVEEAELRASAEAKAARRLKLLSGALAAALVLVIAGAAVAWMFYRAAQKAETQAEKNASDSKQNASIAERNASLALAREVVQSANAANLEHQFERAVLLACQAMQIARGLDQSLLSDAAESLRSALLASRPVILDGFDGGPSSLSWAPDGKRLAALDAGALRIFDAESGQMLKSYPRKFNQVEWSPNGKWLLLYDSTERLVLDPNNGNEVARPGGSGAAAWHPKLSQFALANANEVIVATVPVGKMSLPPEAVLRRWPVNRSIELLTWSPDGSRLAAASGTQLQIWDSQTGKTVLSVDAYSGDDPILAWSPNGTQILTGNPVTSSSAGVVALRDARTGKIAQKLPEFTFGASWSQDGKWIALAPVAPLLRVLHSSDLRLKVQVPALDAVGPSTWSSKGQIAIQTPSRVLIYALEELEADGDALLGVARRKVKRSLTLEECRQYLHAAACPPRP